MAIKRGGGWVGKNKFDKIKEITASLTIILVNIMES